LKSGFGGQIMGIDPAADLAVRIYWFERKEKVLLT
jgi:hypothetical protein